MSGRLSIVFLEIADLGKMRCQEINRDPENEGPHRFYMLCSVR